MNQSFTAVVKRDGEWWIRWIEEVPGVNCQERTRDLREGGSHSWWQNPFQNKRSAIPRHNEINDHPARKICKDLGVPQP